MVKVLNFLRSILLTVSLQQGFLIHLIFCRKAGLDTGAMRMPWHQIYPCGFVSGSQGWRKLVPVTIFIVKEFVIFLWAFAGSAGQLNDEQSVCESFWV